MLFIFFFLMLKKAGAKVGLGFVCYVVKKIKSNLQKILSDSKIYNSVSIAVTKKDIVDCWS